MGIVIVLLLLDQSGLDDTYICSKDAVVFMVADVLQRLATMMVFLD